jgi:hypothetical protein
MSLAAGIKLGPYEIVSPLGRAGWERCTAPPTCVWAAMWR